MGLKAIGQLANYTFKVPKYQRGYRWTKREVEILLEDLWSFLNSGHKEGEFYCLQPIVVKKDGSDENTYTLIDGQQRLTTIYLIFKYFNWDCFSITYETRERSKDFLERIDTVSEKEARETPDFFHMWKAYKTISKWLDKKKREDISNNVRVIWCEIEESEDEIEVFTRLNSGKIPLTDTELIRGYLLLKKHFGENKDLAKRKQLEIASEWDLINAQFQDDRFWYFLSGEDYDTRMDLVFEVLLNTKRDDRYSLFIKFIENYRTKVQSNPEDVWREIKEIYYTLSYWYENFTFYHLVGFLNSLSEEDTAVRKLYKRLKGKDKDRSIQELKEIIKKRLSIEKAGKEIKVRNKSLKELSYENDKSIIEKLLLLYNIATILNQKAASYRFPFDLYRKERWSLEHIHARNSRPIREKDWEGWLELNRNVLEKISSQDENFRRLIEEIDNFLKDKDSSREEKRKKFEELQEKILETLNKLDEDSDGLGNLTLLSVRQNSELNNQTFAVKRLKVIELDKSGKFIPPTTRNVFLKYYTDLVDDPHFWTSEDAKAYLNDIEASLKELLFPSED